MDILTLTVLIWSFIAAEGSNVSQKTKTISRTKRFTKDRLNHIARTLSNFQAEGSPYKIPIYFEDIIYKPGRTNAHQSVNINHQVALTTTTTRTPITGPGVIREPFNVQATQPTFQKPIIRKFRIPVSQQPQNSVGRTFRHPVSQQPQNAIARTFRLPVSQPHNPVARTFRLPVSQQQHNAVARTFRLPVSQQPQNPVNRIGGHQVSQQPQRTITRTASVLQQPINRRQMSNPTQNRDSGVNWRQWNMIARNQRISNEDSDSNIWSVSTNNNRDSPIEDDFTSRSRNRWRSSQRNRRRQNRRSRNRNNRICSCMFYCESDMIYDGPCSSRAFPNFRNLMSRCCLTDYTFDNSVWDENFFSFED